MDSENSSKSAEEERKGSSDRNSVDSARNGVSGSHRKFERILSRLGAKQAEESALIAELRALCDLFYFNELSKISYQQSESLAIVLVALANYEISPRVMLLAIWAMTYICDAVPISLQFFINQHSVRALCAKLGAIEYLDVAEQCVQVLEKISYYHPQACLEDGAVMAVLSYIDFFSLTIQVV